MDLLTKIILTPLAIVFALLIGLFVGLAILIYEPINLMISCICDIWGGVKKRVVFYKKTCRV